MTEVIEKGQEEKAKEEALAAALDMVSSTVEWTTFDRDNEQIKWEGVVTNVVPASIPATKYLTASMKLGIMTPSLDHTHIRLVILPTKRDGEDYTKTNVAVRPPFEVKVKAQEKTDD